MGDCTKVTYEEMWQRMKACYGSQYTEAELRRMHLKWKSLTAEVSIP